MDEARRWLVRQTFPYPARFRLAAMLGQLARPFKRLLPAAFSTMLGLLADKLPPAGPPIPVVQPAIGQRRARVALLAGCVQQVLAPEINQATVRVLAAQGVEVTTPHGQGCCGALNMHIGDLNGARALAARNLRVFPADVDAIISNAAGCGSAMKEYPLLFRGTALEAASRAFAQKVKDVSEFLDGLGLCTAPRPLAQPSIVAYHDACHLGHAQGIWGAPRRLLSAIPNLTLVEIPEGELCCGSAGSYNIEHPDIADQLGQRKVRHILATGAQMVVTGNIGCLVQIRSHLHRAGQLLPVMHTMALLAQALPE
jgi:glycolate oxidase iron-sulfur subunit